MKFYFQFDQIALQTALLEIAEKFKVVETEKIPYEASIWTLSIFSFLSCQERAQEDGNLHRMISSKVLALYGFTSSARRMQHHTTVFKMLYVKLKKHRGACTS